MSDHDTSVLLSNKELLPIVKRLKKAGKKIVLTQGSFDLLHIGHARYCKKAKSYGDVLIVGVDSDAKVRARKGPNRPIVPQAERMEMLTHLKCVDYVVLKRKSTVKFRLIKLIQPEVLVATNKTYDPQTIKELESHCGKVVVLEPMATTSTTAKIRLMQMKTARKIERNMRDRLVKTMKEVLSEVQA